MPAICVSQPSPFVIIFPEKRGYTRCQLYFVEYLVYGSQQFSRLIQRHLTLNLEICLEIRHQQRGGDSLAGDISRYQPETPSPRSRKSK